VRVSGSTTRNCFLEVKMFIFNYSEPLTQLDRIFDLYDFRRRKTVTLGIKEKLVKDNTCSSPLI
jgi:hypothetical protein